MSVESGAEFRAVFEQLLSVVKAQRLGGKATAWQAARTAPDLGAEQSHEKRSTILQESRQSALTLVTLSALMQQKEQLVEQLQEQKEAVAAKLGQQQAQLSALRRQLQAAETTLTVHADAVELIVRRRRRNIKTAEILRRLLFFREELDESLRSDAVNAEINVFYGERQVQFRSRVDDKSFWDAGPIRAETLHAQRAYLAELQAALSG